MTWLCFENVQGMDIQLLSEYFTLTLLHLPCSLFHMPPLTFTLQAEFITGLCAIQQVEFVKDMSTIIKVEMLGCFVLN